MRAALQRYVLHKCLNRLNLDKFEQFQTNSDKFKQVWTISDKGRPISTRLRTYYWNISVMSKAKLLHLKLVHIFARAILLMKKLEIEKTKPTFIISVLKVDY